MPRRYTLTVRGHRTAWCFDIDGTPQDVERWREDGLIIDEVINVIPDWWIWLGLPIRPLCFLQDVLSGRWFAAPGSRGRWRR